MSTSLANKIELVKILRNTTPETTEQEYKFRKIKVNKIIKKENKLREKKVLKSLEKDHNNLCNFSKNTIYKIKQDY